MDDTPVYHIPRIKNFGDEKCILTSTEKEITDKIVDALKKSQRNFFLVYEDGCSPISNQFFYLFPIDDYFLQGVIKYSLRDVKTKKCFNVKIF